MRKTLIIVLLAAAAGAVHGQTKEEDIRRMLEVTGSGELAVQIIEAIIPQFMTLAPNVPETFWNRMRELIGPGEFIDLLVPLYEKYYSHEEIRMLLEFYDSEIGRKTIRVMPEMTRESMRLGQEWGKALGGKIYEEMKKAGYVNA